MQVTWWINANYLVELCLSGVNPLNAEEGPQTLLLQLIRFTSATESNTNTNDSHHLSMWVYKMECGGVRLGTIPIKIQLFSSLGHIIVPYRNPS